MIIGIGTDMVEIARVSKACGRDGFLDRIFTVAEQEQFDAKGRRAASNFAGKEAVVKVLGTGFSSGVVAKEIEILRAENGAPYVRLNGTAQEIARQKGITNIHISITNTSTLATAFAVGSSD